MKTRNQRVGNDGEALAEKFLRAKGYRILGRNVRVGRMGELDLVTERGGLLVFVEVKTRRGGAYGTPEDALTPWKRDALRRAVYGYLAERGLEDIPFRADLIAVEWSVADPVIRHHEAVALEDD